MQRRHNGTHQAKAHKGSPVLDLPCSAGIVDSRQLIMLFLITQRLLGENTAWAPWVAALPDTFSTPPHFRGAEMDELMGTTLHRATRLALRHACLRVCWA